ncbi:MAG: sulfatase [Marinilabiliaceae bacterium]|nr:sulfatase [Marinilabiliaceae bacterium]
MIYRRGYLFVIVTLCILICGLVACHEEKKPNVLFIAVDDLRPELGCYGSSIIQSPNLDGLAAKGRLFKNHFVQIPTCGASRHSLLTGMRPTSTTHLSNEATHTLTSGLPEGENPESFIHHLKRNGYYTVGIGKISHHVDGLLYGYTDSVGTKRELPHSWDEMLFDPGKWETGWNAFFGYADGENRQSMNRQVKPYECADVLDEGYPDGLTANLAVEKLKELKEKGEPFFLGVGFFKPHLPFNAPKKYWDLYDRAEIPLSPTPFVPANVNKKSLHGSGELNGYRLTDEKGGLDGPISDAYAAKLRHAYFASVSYVDAQIGKVLDELKRQDLDKNTIVVVWGDHGWHLGDQLVWGKHTIFENALRSAFIIKTPDLVKKGIGTDAIVESLDLYPTLMELCGVEAPVKLDGESLVSLLENPSAGKDKVAYSYFRNGLSVRTDKYRLTKYFRKEEPVIELYDHLNDPYESVNVAIEKPEIVKQLMPLLEKGNTGLYLKTK